LPDIPEISIGSSRTTDSIWSPPAGGRNLRRPPRRWLSPENGVLGAFVVAVAVGFAWGLPGTTSWAADSLSPRSCGLGAIAETYTPGHFHVYPPLHMALLTLLSLPWMALAAARVGTSIDSLGGELIQPLYMTGIEVSSRLLTLAMGLGVLEATMTLWTRLRSRRTGVLAGAFVAANAVFVYYGHTGNLEVPCLFWILWALVEMDRAALGEPRERRVILLSVFAVLTKDQAASALVVPVLLSMLVLPSSRGRAAMVRFLRASLVGILVYALVSGALVNFSGFQRRLAFVFGPGSRTWAAYPTGFYGAVRLMRDALVATPHFTSWPLAALVLVGVVCVAAAPRSSSPRRSLVPFVAAISFTVAYTLIARRNEDRFLLPQSVLLLPYAAVAVDEALRTWPAARRGIVVATTVALVPAVVAVVSLDATLVTDPRYEVERFLASVSPGSRVDVYGGVIFLPRVPPALKAVRPGIESIADRQAVAGVTDLVDAAMDPRPRDPQLIVLSTELSDLSRGEEPKGPTPYAKMQYANTETRVFLRALFDGSLGYERIVRARCSLPWPLACMRERDSTGGEAWVYEKRPTVSTSGLR
jgi:hypothetical protein